MHPTHPSHPSYPSYSSHFARRPRISSLYPLNCVDSLFASVGLKVLAISALLSVSPLRCIGWLLGEFFLILIVRSCVSGEWRSHVPGAASLIASLGVAAAIHANMMFGVSITIRLQVGPALWAALTAYGVLVNAVIVSVAQVHQDVWILVLAGYVLVAVGWALVGWSSIAPDKRTHFFKHDSLKKYLDREWDTRTASRPGWGESLDAARARVVMTWSHYYWPKEKVRPWLKDHWRSWRRRPPKWFDAKVCVRVLVRRGRGVGEGFGRAIAARVGVTFLLTSLDKPHARPNTARRPQWRRKLAKHAPEGGSPGRRAEAHRRGPGRRVGGVRNGQLAPKPEPTTRAHLRFGSARARSSEA